MKPSIQSYNKYLLARPGQLLEKHLKEVLENGIKLISPKNFGIHEEIIKAGFFFHDVGKAEFSIQNALYSGKKPPISHTHLSVIFFYSWVQEFLKKSLEEIFFSDDEQDRLIHVIGFGILSHHSPPHRNLEDNIFSQLFSKKIIICCEIFDILEKNNFTIDYQTFFNTYNQLTEAFRYNIIDFQFKKILQPRDRKPFVCFSNALIKMDWYSAMGIDPEFRSVDNYIISTINNLIEPKRSVIHNKIYVERKFSENLLLELPTGFGKTFIGLGYAAKTGRKRIIYTLPVTTIIEDVYSKLKNKFREGIEWYTSKYLVAKTPVNKSSLEKSSEEEIDQRNYIEAKYFEKPLIITTLDQLLLAFLGVSKYALKEAAIYDSCIILDEPQLYSPLMLFLFSKFLKDYKDEFNTIIMTATMPPFLKEELDNLFVDSFSSFKEEFFSKFNRTYIDAQKYRNCLITDENFLKDLVQYVEKLLSEGKKVCIIVNTVEKAQNLFKRIPQQFPKFLFHARYIFRDRINKLEELKKRLKSPVVVISTQAIEAGVDVSFDVMFRELAPLDSIIQSAGRVNRYSEHPNPCPVYIFGDEEDYLPYKKEQLKITNEILTKNKLITENQYHLLLVDYWKNLEPYLENDKINAEKYYQAAKEVSPFSIPLDEKKIDLRSTYLKVSVVPIKFYDNVKTLIEKLKNWNKMDFMNRKKIFAEIESHMVEVPYWGRVADKNFKDYIYSDYEELGINFICLKYDEIFGLIPEDDDNIFL
ncbi:MAG: CRISPR-associated helicase Cas3' [Ignisphaera sp.]